MYTYKCQTYLDFSALIKTRALFACNNCLLVTFYETEIVYILSNISCSCWLLSPRTDFFQTLPLTGCRLMDGKCLLLWIKLSLLLLLISLQAPFVIPNLSILLQLNPSPSLSRENSKLALGQWAGMLVQVVDASESHWQVEMEVSPQEPSFSKMAPFSFSWEVIPYWKLVWHLWCWKQFLYAHRPSPTLPYWGLVFPKHSLMACRGSRHC